jgi:hypothetical protein
MLKVARTPKVERRAYFHSFDLQPIKLKPNSARAVRVRINAWRQPKDREVGSALSRVVFNDYWTEGTPTVGLVERNDLIAFEIGLFRNEQDGKNRLGRAEEPT